MITLCVPIEPVAASRPRFNGKFAYTPQKYRLFKEELSFFLKNFYKGMPLDGALEVCIVFSVTKPKSAKRLYPSVKPDLDNFVKAVFDSANLILWEDDSQVVDLHCFKVYGKPSITITIKQKGDE